jgi:hypothetical protein
MTTLAFQLLCSRVEREWREALRIAVLEHRRIYPITG